MSTPDEHQSPAAPIFLRCLHGSAVPEDLSRDAQRIGKLTDGALGALGAVLVPSILEPMSAELGQQLSRLCVRHEVAEADLARVLRVVRFLLQESAASDLDKPGFEQDVRALWKDTRSLADALFGNYELIKRELRKKLLEDTLLKHGNLLVDVDWRVDFVASDRHASKLMLPLALVTLKYKSADETGRLTLQLLPEQLARLQQVFGALAQRTLRPIPEADSQEA
jgi:hypothetical protein